jgi:hypothetical protein
MYEAQAFNKKSYPKNYLGFLMKPHVSDGKFLFRVNLAGKIK